MADLSIGQRIVSFGSAKAKAPAPQAAAAAPKLAGDSFQRTAQDPNPEVALAYATLDKALALPKKPRDAQAQAAWLQDGYARIAQANVAIRTLQKARPDNAPRDRKLEDAIFKTMDAEQVLRDADPKGAAKKRYYEGIAAPAVAILNGLSDIPGPPADKAGKQAWLESNQGVLAKARAASEVANEAWMQGGLTFEAVGDAGHKLYAFQRRVDDVRYELNPPKPLPPGAPGSAPYPLFGATRFVAGGLDAKRSQLTQSAAVIALPLALTLDLMALLSGAGFAPSDK